MNTDELISEVGEQGPYIASPKEMIDSVGFVRQLQELENRLERLESEIEWLESGDYYYQ
jgi:hypothetical protein